MANQRVHHGPRHTRLCRLNKCQSLSPSRTRTFHEHRSRNKFTFFQRFLLKNVWWAQPDCWSRCPGSLLVGLMRELWRVGHGRAEMDRVRRILVLPVHTHHKTVSSDTRWTHRGTDDGRSRWIGAHESHVGPLSSRQWCLGKQFPVVTSWITCPRRTIKTDHSVFFEFVGRPFVDLWSGNNWWIRYHVVSDMLG